jgi:hypothetical protein
MLQFTSLLQKFVEELPSYRIRPGRGENRVIAVLSSSPTTGIPEYGVAAQTKKAGSCLHTAIHLFSLRVNKYNSVRM